MCFYFLTAIGLQRDKRRQLHNFNFYFMAKTNVTAAANVIETANVETAAIGETVKPDLSLNERLQQLNADLIDARRAVRESTDETYDAAAAHAADVKRQIAAVEKQIADENAAIEFNGKRTARRNVLIEMINAQIAAAAEPDNGSIAAAAAATLDTVMNEWMAKFATPPQTAGTPRKQRETNGTAAADDGKLSTTKPELTALYNDAVAAGKNAAAIAAYFYDKYKRSTVWHTLNDIKNGVIAVPQIAA